MHLKSAVLVAGLVLAAGMGSAELLESFGKVAGTADVEGPTFYAAEVDGSNVLSVNEPVEEDDYNWGQIGPDYSSEFFVSPEFDGEDWYEMKVDFFVKAKAADDTESGNIQASLLYDTADSVDNLICSADIYVGSSEYEERSASCTSDQGSKVSEADITGFTYKLEGGRNREFNIQADGITRVEVNAQ